MGSEQALGFQPSALGTGKEDVRLTCGALSDHEGHEAHEGQRDLSLRCHGADWGSPLSHFVPFVSFVVEELVAATNSR